MSDEITTIDIGQTLKFEIVLHPLVGLQIMDLYQRRLGSNQGEKTIVVGTLLGTVHTNKVHVTNCYSVSLEEQNNIFSLDLKQHQSMFELHNEVYPEEVVLGSFVTCPLKLNIEVAFLSQEYSKKENHFISTAVLNQPIVIQFDTSLNDNEFKMKGYRLNQNLKDIAGVATFNTLPISVQFQDESYQQVVPFVELNQNNFKVVQTDNVEENKKQLMKNIKQLQEYVKSVIDGKMNGDQKLGRELLSCLNELESVKKDNLQRQVKVSNEDQQLFQYLSNLSQVQTIVGEQLSKI